MAGRHFDRHQSNLPRHPRAAVEAYAIDQIGLDLYDQEAKLEFGYRLRDTLKFEGLEPLLIQMKLDCQKAKELTA